MARGPFTRGEPDFTRVKSIAAGASALAILALTLLLMVWMVARVAEHPGVPREVGDLPSWFAGERAPRSAREPPAATAEAGAATAATSAKPATADGDYAEFAGGKVEIAFKEYQLTPNKIRVGPGKVTFVLRNEGRYSHDFRINVEGPGIDITTQKFGPGRTIRLEVALQEGEYKISCPLSNHDERGMHGTLIVTARLAAK